MRALAFGLVVLLPIVARLGAADDSGKPAKVPRFAHASIAAYPNAVISARDPGSGMTFYVESDGRRLVALAADGSLAWGLDLFQEVDLRSAVGEPVIRHLRVVGGSLWATCGKSNSVRIDPRTGRAELAGSD